MTHKNPTAEELPETYRKQYDERQEAKTIDHLQMLHRQQNQSLPTQVLVGDALAQDSQKVGRKYDAGKLRHSLIPKGTIDELMKVLEFGATKYEEDNWQHVDDAERRYFDALHRHMNAWHHGERFDKEIGLPHLAHALTCLHFLLWFDLQKDKTPEQINEQG